MLPKTNLNDMKRTLLLIGLLLAAWGVAAHEQFPDGTPIDKWFYEVDGVDVEALGERFVVTDYGVKQDSTLIQTEALQAVIDRAAEKGGVVVIPKGVFLSGSLFFKQGTHLHLEEGAKLKGSDDISNFPILETRIEGQTLNYFAANKVLLYDLLNVFHLYQTIEGIFRIYLNEGALGAETKAANLIYGDPVRKALFFHHLLELFLYSSRI